MRLRPVTYHIGNKAIINVTHNRETPDFTEKYELYTIKYAEFVVPLVKAMQEQQVIIANQQKQIDLLEKRLTALESK